MQDQASLILKLYELRREDTLRKARDWYFMHFNPQSVQEITEIAMGPNSGLMRMVPSYWEMAAALVNHGAIDSELFNDTNGEHIGVFAKLEPFLDDIRAGMAGPNFLRNLEKLIDATPGARERCAAFRERMKAMRAQSQSATSN
jgi:hypothetical protein